MKIIKMALLGGAAMAVTAVAAQADDLDSLKAQIETLNARMAAMETAPAVPAGYQLLAVSGGAIEQTPGLDFTSRERAGYGDKATFISVMPTADAPAGTTISWSGYARAGLIYNGSTADGKIEGFARQDIGDPWTKLGEIQDDKQTDDTDIKARGQLRVKAKTDTAVGEVGVDIRLRANFDGNGNGDMYSDVAWGYWAMTPEVTFGGGYAGSLGDIGYGYDGGCSCYYTDNADVNFNPGDTTQMRLTYASGPLKFAIALEDGSVNSGWVGNGGNTAVNGDKLGVSGEIKYSGDAFSGEISGVWRDTDDNGDSGVTDLWQVGAGVGFSLGDMATLSIGAALGEGPVQFTSEGVITNLPVYNNQWWGVSALASVNVSDAVHFELAAGYKNRQGDNFNNGTGPTSLTSDGIDYDTYAFLGGLYYSPVDQLTIGVEGEWYTSSTSFEVDSYDRLQKAEVSSDPAHVTVDLVSLWRF